MKPAELIALLQDFYRDRLTGRSRHVAGARLVEAYEINNTYQYIIAREDVHLEWLRTALVELGGTVPEDTAEPELSLSAKREERMRQLLEHDARDAQSFVDRWRPRIELITNARHKGMLRVILGEMLEHKRFFEQALAGRRDLLGRRADGAGTGGGVLPERWIE